MICALYTQQSLTLRGKALERPMTRARDWRVAGIKQAIDSIKAVKFYAWEEQYRDEIGRRRDAQLELSVAYRVFVILSINMGKCFPVVAGAITIITVASQRGGTISAAKAFGALAVFQTLRVGMIMLPLCLVLLNTMAATFQRIGDVLVAPEDPIPAPPADDKAPAVAFQGAVLTRLKADGRNSRAASDIAPLAGAKEAAGGKAPLRKRASTIQAVPVVAYPDDDDDDEAKDEARAPAVVVVDDDDDDAAFTLALDDVAIERGAVAAVVGPVGSGKSTLVEAALGRVAATGRVRCARRVGFAPQDPFVATGTIEENILVGRPRDAALLAKAVRFASFERDLEILPDGAETVVGERGTTLSGGQQHRLGVARAVYGDPDLLLLDASLAAVDAAVARAIFDNVKRWTRDDPKRAAVLVLSQLHFLPECDRVLVLEGGAVAADGPCEAVVAKDWPDGSFGAFLKATLDHPGDEGAAKSVDDLAGTTERPTAAATAATAAATEADASEALVKQEKVSRGVVSATVLRNFFQAVGYWRVAAVVFGYVFAGAILAATDVVLAKWTSSRSTAPGYVAAYASGCAGYLVTLLGASYLGVLWTARGSRGMHTAALATVLGAPMGWFEANPSGRILSRFGADFDIVDIDWGNMFDGFLSMSTMFLMLVVMISAIVPVLIPVNLAVTAGLLRTLHVINVANRDVKRLANNAVSPLVTNAAEMSRGRVVSRALGCGAFFHERQRRTLDLMLSGFYTSSCISQAAYANATLWCSAMALCAALVVALVPGLVSPSVAPVALTYALVSPYFASMMSEVYLQMSLMATSVERVGEYMPRDRGGAVPSEAPRFGDADALADGAGEAPWPPRGRVEFDDVSLRYRPGLPLSLTRASFVLEPATKVGVVGRTGAGKSTLLVALFRLVDVAAGAVRIDGVDAAKLGLKLLRQRLCMIPQEAVVMTGTAKANCDPFGDFDDEQVADALEAVGLSRDLLHVHLGETSLSTGERQLLALARALLRRSTVVAFDEATAHVDANTDAKIQKVIETQFPSSTLLAIAHRLHTVIKFDTIIVMDHGAVAEIGAPLRLLDETSGPFATMTNALGAAAKDELRDLARGSLERADVSGNASYLQTHTLYGTGASADDDAYECSCAGFLPGLEY